MLHRAPFARLLSYAAAAALTAAAAACSKAPPAEALQLNGGTLTVDNRTAKDWTGVEIWLNKNHSVRVASIAAGGRLQVPLDAFVAGFGQRFNYKRTQITDLRLKAKLPDGTPVEVVKEFTEGGLAGVFGAKGKR